MSAQNESAKDSVRQSFANLRKALPKGITEADADLLQDVALRLMDRGLPRPAVFRYDGQQFGDGELSALSLTSRRLATMRNAPASLTR